MNTNLIIVLITAGLIYNTYHENFLFKSFQTHKKYYKILFIALVGLGFYVTANKNPHNAYMSINAAKQFLEVAPIDRNAKSMFQPFLQTNNDPIQRSIQRIQSSGKTSSKRSVSESKKKFVAANQNWKCGKCKQQLTAWFEVDHTKRLDQGGTNDVSNLVALCRNCHGEKTTMENF
jgi:hypothetical protein